MSKKKNNQAAPAAEVEQETFDAAVENIEVEQDEILEVPVEEKQPEFVTGKITGCYSLNVREHPDAKANVLYVLPGTAMVHVNVSNDYVDWYHVHADVTANTCVDGFCMKKYISINS